MYKNPTNQQTGDTMKKILIIEDDKDINEMLTRLLSSNSYQTLSAYSGTEGLLLHDNTVDLILLDLMLPGKCGEEIIAGLKEKRPVPVIVMSAIHDTEKKVDLLELGADDYITKPFDNKELLARIRVQLRKEQASVSNTILKYKDIEMNVTDYTVTCNQKNISLTKNEFELLKAFLKHPRQVLTKSVLFDLVWGDEAFADDNTLNVHISKLRNKLKECSPDNQYIETVWSVGYKLYE